jgi:hypothetical protein
MPDRRNGEPQLLGEILRDAARADLEPERQTPLSILLQAAPKIAQPAPEAPLDDGKDGDR